MPAPVFSTPCATPSGAVVLGCVDGVFVCLSGEDGILLWQHSVGAPIFSSPCLLPISCPTESWAVCFGAHDGSVRALSASSGRVLWALSLGGGEVYASPCPVSPPTSPSSTLVVVCTTKGRLSVLRAGDGEVVGEKELGTQIYSSPVALPGRGSLIVGCRDDFLCRFDME